MPETNKEPLEYNALGQEIVYNQSWSAQTPGTYADLNKPILAWHLADILERERSNGRNPAQLLQHLATLSTQQQMVLDEAIDEIAETFDDQLAELLGHLSDQVVELLRQSAGTKEPPTPAMYVVNSDVFGPPTTGQSS